MKKGIKVIKNLFSNGYLIEGVNNGKQNRISKTDLVKLIDKVEIHNEMENDLVLYSTDIEPFEDGFDVNLTEYTIYSEESKVRVRECDEQFKTYKRLTFAEKYEQKLQKEYM